MILVLGWISDTGDGAWFSRWEFLFFCLCQNGGISKASYRQIIERFDVKCLAREAWVFKYSPKAERSDKRAFGSVR